MVCTITVNDFQYKSKLQKEFQTISQCMHICSAQIRNSCTTFSSKSKECPSNTKQDCCSKFKFIQSWLEGRNYTQSHPEKLCHFYNYSFLFWFFCKLVMGCPCNSHWYIDIRSSESLSFSKNTLELAELPDLLLSPK